MRALFEEEEEPQDLDRSESAVLQGSVSAVKDSSMLLFSDPVPAPCLVLPKSPIDRVSSSAVVVWTEIVGWSSRRSAISPFMASANNNYRSKDAGRLEEDGTAN